MRNYIKMLRPIHWIKNILIFFPMIFSRQFMDKTILENNIWGWLAFCVISSVVYILNDIKDADKDRLHPTKCKRPIAAGKVTVKNAIIVAVFLIVICFMVGVKTEFKGFIWIIAYFTTNIIYSYKGKRIPLLDVSLLMLFYVIRIYYGGNLTGVKISDWMLLTVMCAAYYLGFGKRKKELERIGNIGRTSLSGYSLKYLEECTRMFEILTVIFYSLACASNETTFSKAGINFIYTVPIVIIIILRYKQKLDFPDCDGDPVEVVISDPVLIILISIYIIVGMIIALV